MSGLPLVEVEFRQSYCRQHGYNQNRYRQQAGEPVDLVWGKFVQTATEPCVDDHGRSHPEGDDIRQRIQFLADRRRHLEQAGREPVEEIENGGHYNPKGGTLQVAGQGRYHGKTSASQITAGQYVGNVFFHKELRV